MFQIRLQEEFRRSSRFGLGIALDMYPIMMCDNDEAPNLYQAKVGMNLSTVAVAVLAFYLKGLGTYLR